jgi:hypothetical protein
MASVCRAGGPASCLQVREGILTWWSIYMKLGAGTLKWLQSWSVQCMARGMCILVERVSVLCWHGGFCGKSNLQCTFVVIIFYQWTTRPNISNCWGWLICKRGSQPSVASQVSQNITRPKLTGKTNSPLRIFPFPLANKNSGFCPGVWPEWRGWGVLLRPKVNTFVVILFYQSTTQSLDILWLVKDDDSRKSINSY